MKISTHSYESVDIVQMPKELTLQNAKIVAKVFAELVDTNKSGVILNMSDLSFTDSTGLSLLVKITKKFLSHGGRVLLVSPQPNLMSLLQLTHIEKLFEFFDDTNEAIRYLGKA